MPSEEGRTVTRLQEMFSRSSGDGRLAFGAYVVAGYPDYGTSLEAIGRLADAGVDMIEVGIPHSDPVADGKVLQEASRIALKGGMNPPMALDLAREARGLVDLPILVMTYYNPVLQYGPERFCADCGRFDLDGLLIPDLPIEESAELLSHARREGQHVIYFLSPNSPRERIRLTAGVANGVVYAFSVLGVTGERSTTSRSLPHFVQEVRGEVKVPVCVGFGVSNPEQVRQIHDSGADGIIVGSGIARRLGQGLDSVEAFARALGDACR
jgi:tryptophan synthase alpha chain